MTPRQAKLVTAAEACGNAARTIEMDFPRSELDDPMTSPMRRELIASRQRDVAALKLAEASMMKLADDPDAYALLMDLRDKQPTAFTAIMVLVKIELDRPAAEQEVAA
ncbi:hypothetical protein [Devosia sp. FJ2-5-3]|uniref:hypothetical protein n=1 Tax=Devosia sp. FJ2-5-3 TaxID=2976680 RepID=UPI0023D7F44F|nr:hypothetical protein [Devosia sp. FJ2-5-3]WEJ60211.1 hypothetical protein N0P34_09315 [Devosia sp. FJ2-5-3]